MPFADVEPAQATAPNTGLVASALRPDNTGTRWVQGMSWRPERCGFTTDGFSPCEAHAKTPGAGPDVVHYVPPGFAVVDRCTVLDSRQWDDARERVTRQVLAATSYVAARELWSGPITRQYPGQVDGSPYINPYLADGNATQVTGTFATAVEALAALEAAALDESHGQQVFLHVSPEWVPYLSDVVRRQGNLLLTKNDSVVVADGGYPGTGDVTAGTSEVQNVALSGGTLDGTSEVQNLAITGSPTGGTFTITVQTETTAPIAFDATAADVQAALEALTIVDPGDVTCTGGPLPGTDVTLTWDASLGNVAQPTADGSGLTGGTTPDATITTTTEGEAPVTGTFTLTYDGETTDPIDVDATTGEVHDALEALPNLDTGDIDDVTGTAGDWNVVFDATLGNVTQMTADSSGLSGGSAPTITVTTTTEGSTSTTAAGLWAYATGPVSMRLTDVQVIGASPEQMDRHSNRRDIIGERIFAATFDPCVQLKVEASALS